MQKLFYIVKSTSLPQTDNIKNRTVKDCAMRDFLLALLSFSPFQSTLVCQRSHFKFFECSCESFPIRAGTHQTHHNRAVILQPASANHGVFFVIMRKENLYSVQSADCLNLDRFWCICQLNYAPVAGAMRNNSTNILLAINVLNTCLYPILMINAQHQPYLFQRNIAQSCPNVKRKYFGA